MLLRFTLINIFISCTAIFFTYANSKIKTDKQKKEDEENLSELSKKLEDVTRELSITSVALPDGRIKNFVENLLIVSTKIANNEKLSKKETIFLTLFLSLPIINIFFLVNSMKKFFKK